MSVDPHIRMLGQQPYEQVWREMQQYTEMRDDKSSDQLWIVEHPPVFTMGQAAKPEHLLCPGNIPVVQSDRGGQVTYHGSGQVVIYLLLNLKRWKIGVRSLVNLIEASVIDYLATQEIEAVARRDAPGVYVDGKKIAALGLRVRRGCCYHGLSFNINMDLEPFERINPCGYKGLQVTQLIDLTKKLNPEYDFTERQSIAARLCAGFTKKLQLSQKKAFNSD